MWQYQNPVQIISGDDALLQLKDLVGKTPYAIVTYSGELFASYVEHISEVIGHAPVCVFADTEENPSFAYLRTLCQTLNTQAVAPELFLALGGGSVMDTTKVLAASGGNFQSVADFLQGKLTGDALTCKPIIALPTTAGTGSEVTCWGTVWDKENASKYSLADVRLYPKAAIVHAPFTVQLPYSVTLSTGLDALSHAFESLWNVNRNPVSATFAVTAAKRILTCLPKLLKDLNNLKLRTQMQEAALLAGMAFSNTKTSIAHNISYAITLEKGTVHGIACSFTLPTIMRAIDPQDDELNTYIEDIFALPTLHAAEALQGFLHDLDVATCPTDYGYEQAAWAALLANASKGARGQNFSGDIERLNAQFEQMFQSA